MIACWFAIALAALPSCASAKGWTVTKQFFANGKPRSVLFFSKEADTTEYTAITYFENGRVDSEAQVRNGMPNGYCRVFFANGNRKMECSFVNGRRHGIMRAWYDNGKPRYEGYYKNGVQNGIWKVWTEDDKLFVKTIKKGYEDGRIIEFIINEKGIMKIISAKNKANNQEGIWKLYDTNNNLLQTTIFNKGALNGNFMEYFPNGKIKATGKLMNGFYDGIVRYYDVAGYVTLLKKYRLGKVVAVY